MLYLSASCYLKASTKTNFIQHKSKYHDSLSNIQEPLQDHLAINLILNKRGKNAWLSVYLAVCFLSVCQSACLSICLPVFDSVFLLFCLLFYLYVGLSNLSVGQVVCLSAFCQSVSNYLYEKYLTLEPSNLKNSKG